nr:type III-B CRISPR module RAMP protein Cmr4 [Candidatus Freyarchaeota archaeon]
MSSKSIIVSPYENADLILIRAVTNLHPGVGRGGEMVDLPVQKDNLGFPIIYSSSLKGALKSTLWQFNQPVIRALFGPEVEEGEEKFNSAVAILDVFTITFPVRSLEGVYAYATSPVQLKRFYEYLKLTGAEARFKIVEELSKLDVSNDVCYMSKNDHLKNETIQNRIIINEEVIVNYKKDDNLNNKMSELEKILEIEEGRLILLSNDNALRAMEKSLVRVTRTALEKETKKVKGGALWTEEYIPWETKLITALLYSKPRTSLDKLETSNIPKDKLQKGTRDTIHYLLERIGWYLIIGGDETVGKGIVKLELLSKGGKEA